MKTQRSLWTLVWGGSTLTICWTGLDREGNLACVSWTASLN